ncbi:alanyl-tRNA editing protein [Natronomonas sp. EA1]|uniref:alanyl-tRNA editing protein n=1 Tax=Natronomonas sp. EA1 TaxID=3421655 RepID=UPI003EBFFB5E
MTDALYMDDSSVRRFEATVDRSLDGRVVLDRTHFYPDGGGQPADHGVLRADGEEWAVTDVRKTDTIYHHVDGEIPEGTVVEGELDWERRYAHMRYHTAQHLLSALLLEEFDAPTRGNQLYADRARIDVAHGRFTDEDLAQVEARMNELVADARSVTWYTMDREEAEKTLDTERTRIDLLPDSIRELRIVEIEGYDRTACAGTHVTNTEACGRVEVTGRESGGKDRERLHFTLA